MALRPKKVELRRGKGGADSCHGCIQNAQDNSNMVQGHLPGMVVGQVEAAVAQAFTDGHREYNGDFVLC